MLPHKTQRYLCILTMHFHALPATLQLFYSLADPSHTVWSMTTLSKQNVHLSKHLNYPYVSFCAPNHSDKTPLSKNQMNRWWRQKYAPIQKQSNSHHQESTHKQLQSQNAMLSVSLAVHYFACCLGFSPTLLKS